MESLKMASVPGRQEVEAYQSEDKYHSMQVCAQLVPARCVS